MTTKIQLKSNKRNIKRVGRGISAGGGKTAGRGTKGQNSRAGHNIPNRFEGGQTPLSMRLPKLPGFNKVTKNYIIISLDEISKKFKNGQTVSAESLEKNGMIKKGQKAKILANGKLEVKIILKDVAASKSVLKLTEAKEKTK